MKIKPLSKEQILISIDRLTRFKLPEEQYLRVYKEVITAGLIEPKFKKNVLDSMDYAQLAELAEKIFNYSLENLGLKLISEYSINKKLLEYEKKIFKISPQVEKLFQNRINYLAVTELITDEDVFNLRWLKSLKNGDITSTNRNANLYPIEKIILVEGITEEILLPEFAKLAGYNFKEHGVFVLSAGGKSQVVKYFYKYCENLKIPIFVLLDSDAKENYAQIKPKLRSIDNVYLINGGEFEDILPKSLIKRALNYETQNISSCDTEKLENSSSTVEFLETFFKNRGAHEFKKAEFAKVVKANLLNADDISEDIREIFDRFQLSEKLSR